MMPMVIHPGVVRFRSTGRWDTKYLLQPGATSPFGDSLGDDALRFDQLCHRRFQVVTPELKVAGVPLGSIHFTGRVTIRSAHSSTAKGKLFLAHPGDVVFSKIDARNGAIAVIPPGETLAFSAEYPIYAPNDGKDIDASYLALVLRSGYLKSLIGSLVVGHSGRRRLAPHQMEQLRIPLPDLSVQRALVSQMRKAEYTADALTRRAGDIESRISRVVLGELGIEDTEETSGRQPFIARLARLSRWGVDAARRREEPPVCDYPVRRLGERDVSTVSYGLQKSPMNRPGANARPYLRVANVQADALDLREVKLIDVNPAQAASLELEYGDLLLCEGNSEEHVGRPAMWRNEIPGCVHQNHVLRVRVNRALLDPEYVLAYMGSPPARRYFRGRAKRTTNLASINGTDVRECPLPVPPPAVQEKIVTEARKLREEREELLTRARNTLEAAEGALDAQIIALATR